MTATERAPVVKSVELTTGVRLPYVEQGDPAGVPVVLLHGLSDSWRSFALLLPHLPASIRAFALTPRGHGDADRPATGYGPRDFAADLAAFLDAVGLEAAVVAGHSSGAITAQRFALDYPARTLGIVLIGSPRSLRGNPAVAEFAEALAAQTDPIDPDLVRGLMESIVARPVPPSFLDAAVEESRTVPVRVWRAVLGGLMDDDSAAELDRIAAPILIVWGDRDAMIPRGDQEAMAAAIPGARRAVYPGVGHSPHWEEPARVAADLAAFVETDIRQS